jgi:hypothetical protein
MGLNVSRVESRTLAVDCSDCLEDVQATSRPAAPPGLSLTVLNRPVSADDWLRAVVGPPVTVAETITNGSRVVIALTRAVGANRDAGHKDWPFVLGVDPPRTELIEEPGN